MNRHGWLDTEDPGRRPARAGEKAFAAGADMKHFWDCDRMQQSKVEKCYLLAQNSPSL